MNESFIQKNYTEDETKKDFYKFILQSIPSMTTELLSGVLSQEVIASLRIHHKNERLTNHHAFGIFFVAVQQIERFKADKDAYRNRENLKIYRAYCDSVVKRVKRTLPYINEKRITLNFPMYPPLGIKVMETLMQMDNVSKSEIDIYKDLINESIYPYDRLKSSTSFETMFNAKDNIEQQKSQFIYILRW